MAIIRGSPVAIDATIPALIAHHPRRHLVTGRGAGDWPVIGCAVAIIVATSAR